jgi:CheY-like chemotaxis protein
MPSAVMTFKADEVKLKQIFNNLLDNALKFTSQGTIRFGFQMPENGTITFYVSDTGIGIAPEFHSSIFQRFRQAENIANDFYGGIGLGLSICKGNVELMKGQIRVESEPGEGSRFYFCIPYEPIIDGKKRTELNMLPAYNWKYKNIILVEDDEDNIKYIELILRKTGANIMLATDSASFLTLITQIPDVHLVLMDIQLPGEDGWQLTRYIKSLRREIPIIIQTAYGSDSHRIISMDAGCDLYLAKPISPDELLKAIAICLEK